MRRARRPVGATTHRGAWANFVGIEASINAESVVEESESIPFQISLPPPLGHPGCASDLGCTLRPVRNAELARDRFERRDLTCHALGVDCGPFVRLLPPHR